MFTFFGRYYALPNSIQKYNRTEDLLFKTWIAWDTMHVNSTVMWIYVIKL